MDIQNILCSALYLISSLYVTLFGGLGPKKMEVMERVE